MMSIIKRAVRVWSVSSGFTLVELLVAMAIVGIVMAGIYSIFFSQQRAYTAQEQMADMEQRARSAMYFMNRDISMAGCDPTGRANARIVTADPGSIRFTEDLNGDGNTDEYNEDITYSLYTSGGIQKLGRRSPFKGTNQPVAEDVDALNFVYLDKSGDVLAEPVAHLSEIRAVQITLVVRAEAADPRYTDRNVYRNQQGAVILGPKNDHFRRRLMTSEVLCRNLAF